MTSPSEWLVLKKAGLYCIPGQFYIDPILPVTTAVISHAHSDHAIPGHQSVIAQEMTIEIMNIRFEDESIKDIHPLNYHEKIKLHETEVYLLPAGHILGSAQIVIEYKGSRAIISGDYKRRSDPTCESFIAEPCDLFITEATFGLPIFKHPPIELEINKLLQSLESFPERCHLIGVYALGKCQRLISALRSANYTKPVYLHGSLEKMCHFYKLMGIELGDVRPADSLALSHSAGEIVLCPPSALHSRWNRRFANVLFAMASGWMQIRARAKQKGIELPLIISDHADWFELTQTLQEVNPKEVWVTHGQEEALVYYASQQGYQAQALHLLGYEDESEA